VNAADLAQQWRPPLQASPFTEDRAEALEWMQALAPMGIEGVLAKRATSRYTRGAEWLKVRFRETMVGVIGAVVGPISAPEALIIGQVDDTGSLTILGRTSALSPAASSCDRGPSAGTSWRLSLARRDQLWSIRGAARAPDAGRAGWCR